MTRTRQETHTEHADPHWVEWLTGIVSALLVMAMLAWIAKEALLQTGEPPDFVVETVATERTAAGQYRVTFDLSNTATTTAAAVTVRGTISEAGTVTETSEITFDYVPAESETSGAMLFRRDPGGKTVDIAVTGYTEP